MGRRLKGWKVGRLEGWKVGKLKGLKVEKKIQFLLSSRIRIVRTAKQKGLGLTAFGSGMSQHVSFAHG